MSHAGNSKKGGRKKKENRSDVYIQLHKDHAKELYTVEKNGKWVYSYHTKAVYQEVFNKENIAKDYRIASVVLKKKIKNFPTSLPQVFLPKTGAEHLNYKEYWTSAFRKQKTSSSSSSFRCRQRALLGALVNPQEPAKRTKIKKTRNILIFIKNKVETILSLGVA